MSIPPPFMPTVPLNEAQALLASNSILRHVPSLCVTISSKESLPKLFDLVKSVRSATGTEIVADLTVCDAFTAETWESVVEILDGGVSKVIVPDAIWHKVKEGVEGGISPERGIVSGSAFGEGGAAGGMIRGESEEQIEEAVSKIKNSDTADLATYYVRISKDTPTEAVLKASAAGFVPLVPYDRIVIEEDAKDGQISLSKLFFANAKTDRADGLYATVVTDVLGIALGLVYSSPLSVVESFKTGRGVYQSRQRGLWRKGETSGDIQELLTVSFDCDSDALKFVVRQKGRGFCHTGAATCWGPYSGLAKLQKTLEERKENAPKGSYTARLFSDPALLKAKLAEEAGELAEARTKDEVSWEVADLIYFALTKCVAEGVGLEDLAKELDRKGLKVKRRRGDAKVALLSDKDEEQKQVAEASGKALTGEEEVGKITMTRYDTTSVSRVDIIEALKRPSQRSSETIMGIVQPIIKDIQERGDKALLEYTQKFEKATSLQSPVLKAPFAQELMNLPPETIEAIDVSFENIRKFHAAQADKGPLMVETMPGVVCSRFSRPIERVGLYVPGGTAVLPSTALMLGIPAMVAGCKTIVLASPPRQDGSVTPEIVYAAHKVGAESIVLAGGAQAVAAMAYGTESVSKVDKILGPGNQFVTAAKMFVSNDTSASVAIDMPAGPSEVLVIADETAEPAFVAADLLSQAEHGVDSQVVLIAINLDEAKLQQIEDEVDKQAHALPRVDIVSKAIEHSVTLVVKSLEEAMELSNLYAPEHLILQIKDAEKAVDSVQNAGSVFIGEWTPESVGDYSAGVNHSLRKLALRIMHDETNTDSNLWIRPTVFRCKSWIIYQAHHLFTLDRGRTKECGWRSDAVGKGGRARGSQKGSEHST
jgi:phosphoribosyl-ATP pyrophosphohydrolase/phosphoribosyl-AMP cyclohydrolase/histidinol dehydrogenase